METDYFGRFRPAFGRLGKKGFRKTETEYRYEEDFLDGQFRAELVIRQEPEGSAPGGWQIRGRVMDLDTEEEYLPIRARHQLGGFVGGVREAYLEVLGRIREECFVPVDFIYDQANRITAMIGEVYGDAPEFPWEKYPGNGTFKCKENGKWYAAILNVAFGKLGAAGGHDANDIVEVINLKAEPEGIAQITRRPGIFPAWHMNKKHWISVILDDTLADDEVMELIGASYDLVSVKKNAGHVSGDAWIIPSSPKVYDIDAGFAAGGGVIQWHQHNNIHPGDEVYIYSAAPNSAIMYRTVVEESDLPYNGMFRGKEGYVRSMRIRLVEKYPKDRYSLSFMRANGGSPVRSARRMPAQLLEAMKQK